MPHHCPVCRPVCRPVRCPASRTGRADSNGPEHRPLGRGAVPLAAGFTCSILGVAAGPADRPPDRLNGPGRRLRGPAGTAQPRVCPHIRGVNPDLRGRHQPRHPAVDRCRQIHPPRHSGSLLRARRPRRPRQPRQPHPETTPHRLTPKPQNPRARPCRPQSSFPKYPRRRPSAPPERFRRFQTSWNRAWLQSSGCTHLIVKPAGGVHANNSTAPSSYRRKPPCKSARRQNRCPPRARTASGRKTHADTMSQRSRASPLWTG